MRLGFSSLIAVLAVVSPCIVRGDVTLVRDGKAVAVIVAESARAPVEPPSVKGAKKRAAKAAMGPGKRGPGRPRKNASAGVDGLDGIVAAVRTSRQELARYQSAIERIGSIIASIGD